MGVEATRRVASFRFEAAQGSLKARFAVGRKHQGEFCRRARDRPMNPLVQHQLEVDAAGVAVHEPHGLIRLPEEDVERHEGQLVIHGLAT